MVIRGDADGLNARSGSHGVRTRHPYRPPFSRRFSAPTIRALSRRCPRGEMSESILARRVGRGSARPWPDHRRREAFRFLPRQHGADNRFVELWSWQHGDAVLELLRSLGAGEYEEVLPPVGTGDLPAQLLTAERSRDFAKQPRRRVIRDLLRIDQVNGRKPGVLSNRDAAQPVIYLGSGATPAEPTGRGPFRVLCLRGLPSRTGRGRLPASMTERQVVIRPHRVSGRPGSEARAVWKRVGRR
jgi:hypothetical protein